MTTLRTEYAVTPANDDAFRTFKVQILAAGASLEMAFRHIPVDTDERFHLMLATVFKILPVTQRQLADDLGVSLPTIHLWVAGTSAPHPLLAERVKEWVVEQVDRINDQLPKL